MAKVTDKQAVLEAVRLFDEMGRDIFLKENGFGRAKRFFLKLDGKLYDSKAIYGVAHGLQHKELGGLTGTDFSGGELPVKQPLEELGFEVKDISDADGHSASNGNGAFQNWPELEEMRARFLSRCPDFRDFEQEEGVYFAVERDYKDEILVKFEKLLNESSDLDDRALGNRALDLLNEKPANFLSWRIFNDIRDAGEDGAGEIATAIGEMLRSEDDPPQLVERAALHIEPHLPPRSFGNIRSLVTAPLAFSRPNDAVLIKTRFMQGAIRELTGSILFRQQVIDADEYGNFLNLMRRIEGVMRDDWGWKPYDLWDVQGFIWVVMAKDWEESEGDLENEEAVSTHVSTGEGQRGPLNQILYGPPGTGKTWTTADIAVRICNGGASIDRRGLMAEYERLRSAGRIALTTFHQSLGYEEFVEGLRPVTDAGDDDAGTGGFRLEPQNGIFREICALAEQARAHSPGEAPLDLQGRRFFKMSLGRTFDEPHIYEAAMAGGYVVLAWGGDVDWSPPEYDAYENILAEWREIEPGVSGKTGNVTQVYRFRSTMRVGDIVIVADGNHRFRAIGEITGDYQFQKDAAGNHRRAVKWLRKFGEPMPVSSIYERQFSPAACYLLDQEKLKVDVIADLIDGDGSDATTERPNYVLIIDEINRANISKVLGELITLIEPDKRLGSDNALKVTLPYSKDNFGVPSNLYIVGTMNTADRSIAMLDTALRRRFEFIEMMPNYDVIDREVDGVHLGDFLMAINRRVEWLFDREHQIGHAYLTVVQDKATLDEAMRRRIIPLLAEYFYEDWEKVRAALNDSEGHFIEREELQPPQMLEQDDEMRMRFVVRDGPFPIEGYNAAIS